MIKPKINHLSYLDYTNFLVLKDEIKTINEENEQYIKGKLMGRLSKEFFITVSGTWSAKLKDEGTADSYEKIGHHVGTAAFLKGIIDSGVKMTVSMEDETGKIVKKVIREDQREIENNLQTKTMQTLSEKYQDYIVIPLMDFKSQQSFDSQIKKISSEKLALKDIVPVISYGEYISYVSKEEKKIFVPSHEEQFQYQLITKLQNEIGNVQVIEKKSELDIDYLLRDSRKEIDFLGKKISVYIPKNISEESKCFYILNNDNKPEQLLDKKNSIVKPK